MMNLRTLLHLMVAIPSMVFSVSSHDSDFLESKDVPLIMEEMFAHHVEYQSLNVDLVKRSVKLFIDHVDADKTYLLQKEAEPYLNFSEKAILDVVRRYEVGDLSPYQTLN
jgi:hypothetical protein